MGDFSSDIYTLGWHKESVITRNAPFFLQEIRRRLFVKTALLHVFQADIYGRPPRVLRRFSDVKMPLDLADDQLCGTPEVLETARANLAPSGWNRNNGFYPASLCRFRAMCAEIREEIYEFTCRPAQPIDIDRLTKLAAQNKAMWDEIPMHLRADAQEAEAAGFSYRVTQMLARNQLGFNKNDFLIYQAMEQIDPSAITPLLSVAVRIAKTLVDLGTERVRHVQPSFDYAEMLIVYGTAPAVVLVQAIHKLARHGPDAIKLPEDVTRSTLIRTVSNLISQCENAGGRGEVNADVCLKASQIISRSLDEALNASPAPMPSTSESLGAMEVTDFGGMDLSIWDTNDVSTWMNMDWGRMGMEAF